MYSGMDETMCTRCSHQKVCSLKDQFLKAQKAVDDVSVTLASDGNMTSFKRLRDFDWIRRVKLECIHFEAKWEKIQDSSPGGAGCYRIGPGEVNCAMEDPKC